MWTWIQGGGGKTVQCQLKEAHHDAECIRIFHGHIRERQSQRIKIHWTTEYTQVSTLGVQSVKWVHFTDRNQTNPESHLKPVEWFSGNIEVYLRKSTRGMLCLFKFKRTSSLRCFRGRETPSPAHTACQLQNLFPQGRSPPIMNHRLMIPGLDDSGSIPKCDFVLALGRENSCDVIYKMPSTGGQSA